ncbi:MAG TPA: hypothetical protein ENJ79_04640 [Gammaproteobacteria bacterium]|nr:hypothetical protein [Gammaproteobacteria bacterium]
MVDIGNLPPAWRILPGQPGQRPGQGNRAPARKPSGEQDSAREQRKQRRRDGDSHIDEYA